MENKKLFNTWKKQVEHVRIKSQIDCLRIVEVNLSNVCNLKCPFCPRSKDWPIKDPQYMSVDTARQLADQLRKFNFQGYICVAGFGEPMINPNAIEILKQFQQLNVVVVSNGTLRSKQDWEEISEFAQIKISVHHWDQIDQYKEKFAKTNAWFRNHDMVNPQMNTYNRAGALGNGKKLDRICHFPFYKVFVDTDGSYLRCEADWSRASATGHSIWNTDIDLYFTEVMEKDRLLMVSNNHRQNLSSCTYCDIDGTMTGRKFVDYWIRSKCEQGEDF